MNATKTSLSIALGAAIGIAGLAQASGNPFALKTLDQGYMVAAADGKAQDGKCGEGKCGGSKPQAKSADDKSADGKCGEGKCGGKPAAKATAKSADGKCGEGKCGGKK